MACSSRSTLTSSESLAWAGPARDDLRVPLVNLFIVIAVVAVLAVVLGVMGHRQSIRRQAQLRQVAAAMSLDYRPDDDHRLGFEFACLERMHQGQNRRVAHVLRGRLEGHPVLAFDYHYETEYRDHDNRQKTRRHSGSYRILRLPRSFPRLLIDPEGWFAKVGQAMGFEDIDFESHEFSQQFRVRSADRKFAYDVCHVRMMALLLEHPQLDIQIEDAVLALHSNRRLKPESLTEELSIMLKIRQLLPDYLFTETP